MISETIPALASLSPEDKLLLAKELLQQVVGLDQEEGLPLSSELISVLEESLSEYRANPNQGVRWEELRDRLKSEAQS